MQNILLLRAQLQAVHLVWLPACSWLPAAAAAAAPPELRSSYGKHMHCLQGTTQRAGQLNKPLISQATWAVKNLAKCCMGFASSSRGVSLQPVEQPQQL